MNLRNKRIISVLFGLVITISTLFLAINVQSLTLSTQNFDSTEAMYMIIEAASGPINGGSTDTGHEGQVDIYQYSHNLYSSSSSAHGAATVSHTPLTVVKMIDKASVYLWEALSIGSVIPRVQLLFYSTLDGCYFNITLTSAQVVSILSDAEIGLHFEMVSFIYGTIYWTDEINQLTRSSTWI